jgi:hypothetical protein
MTPAIGLGKELLHVLFLVEGYTDIRFVLGLSQICNLTMAIPAPTYESSALKQRRVGCGVAITVDEIPGGRRAARATLGLTDTAFLVLVASRVSHEKDPETALRAVARARARGLDAVVMNLQRFSFG